MRLIIPAPGADHFDPTAGPHTLLSVSSQDHLAGPVIIGPFALLGATQDRADRCRGWPSMYKEAYIFIGLCYWCSATRMSK